MRYSQYHYQLGVERCVAEALWKAVDKQSPQVLAKRAPDSG